MAYARSIVATVLLAIVVAPAGAADEDGARSAPSLDDVLGGFDDDVPSEPDTARAPDDAGPEAWLDRHLEVGGSASVGVSYNVVPHRSTVGPDPTATPGTGGTYFGNLQRLRTRGDIEAELSLPHDARARVSAFGYYDFAYLIHGESSYSAAVLRDYQLEGELLDAWLQLPVGAHLDLKLGRQVVNWGRAETLRVADFVNALNNREPGLVDIEELRLPSTMARADLFLGRFAFSALLIPEIRYDYDPPPGSDFFPRFDLRDIPDPPPGFPLTKDEVAAALADELAALLAQDLPATRASQWGATPEFAAAATARFGRGDASLYAARLYQNRTTPVISLPAPGAAGVFSGDDRVTLLGAGGGVTVGSFLLEAELAWLLDLDAVVPRANPDWQPSDPFPGYLAVPVSYGRVDTLLGVEYFGFRDRVLALELAYRRVTDYASELRFLPNYVYRDNVELALRAESSHAHDRLRLMAVALLLANEDGFAGGWLRLSFDYELAEASVLTFGYLAFFAAEPIPFDTWGDNDRLFAKLKLSF